MVFPTGGGEATNLENIEALYASVRSWGMKEEGGILFPPWKGVDEYQYPVETTSISSNFAVVFPEVASLLNSRAEQTVILNNVMQDNNKVLGYKRNETFKFHRL